MANLAVRRIRRELTQVMESEKVAQTGIKVELTNDSFYELSGEIMGPPDTPYEGGKFELEIKIPDRYPFEPPEIRFVSMIWHPNISSGNGFICLDILSDRWSASLTLRTVLLSLQVLLSAPEPGDPLDPVVARQFVNNREMFELTARHWTNVYAGGPSKNESFNDKIREMMELGVIEDDARAVLSSSDWDLEIVTEKFYSIVNQYESCEDDESDGDQMEIEGESNEEDHSENEESEDDESEGEYNYDDQNEDD